MGSTSSPASEASPPPATAHRNSRLLWLLAIFGGTVVVAAAGYFWIYPQVEASRHWRAALQALEQDDLSAARDHLTQVTHWRPNDAEACFLAARTARRLGQYDSAEQLLERAASLGYDQEAVDLERVLLQADAGDFRQVEDTLITHIRTGHYEEDLIFESLVRGFLRQQRLEAVHHWSAIWTSRYPDAWQPWYRRGQAYELVPQLNDAADAYRKALKLRPDKVEVEYHLGDVLRRLNLYQEALPHLENCYRRRPHEPRIVATLARCLRSLARIAAARDLLDQWLASHQGKYPELLTLRGRLEHDMQRPEQALQWFLKAEAIAPRHEETIVSLANVYRDLGRTEEAERYALLAKDIYNQMNQVERLTREIRKDPNNASLQYELGRLLIRLGHADKGVDWLKGALQLDPRYRAAHLALADYYLSVGKRELASLHRRAAAMASTSPAAP